MATPRQDLPTTKSPHFATLLVMALAPEEVGKRIRAARVEKGWTHEELRDAYEEATGRRRNLRTIQRWQKGWDEKKGKSTLPRLGELMDLADVLDLPRSYFVEQEQPADDDVLARMGRLVASQEQQSKMLAELLRLVRGDQAPPESVDQ